MAFDVFAPAKINLSLHVTGRRTDGYHLLDSLVVFADIGDTIHVVPSDTLSLTVLGPEAVALQDETDNLVLRAARMMDPEGTARITLTKRLPVASGIGGGSADAAAALRALAQLWDKPFPSLQATLALGADVPVCLNTNPMRMRGIGENLSQIPALPDLEIMLVNPRVPVSTPQIFKSLQTRNNPAMQEELPDWNDAKSFVDWLSEQRNDLQPPAIVQAPVIAEVLDYLSQSGSLLSRMSGSGATCFGLFAPGQAPKTPPPNNWWGAVGKIL